MYGGLGKQQTAPVQHVNVPMLMALDANNEKKA